jgi:transcriptional regulator with XRE-family HTH domain
MIMKSPESAKARGERLKSLRESLKLSRQKFADKHCIPKGTMQNWEDGRFNGLSESGAKKVLEALETEGIHCSLEWLMYGTGQPPALPQSILEKTRAWITEPDLSQEQIIRQELLLFHQLNKGSIDAIVPDNKLSPALLAGDLVAGKRYFEDDIVKAVGSVCIVQTSEGETLVRLVREGKKTGCFDLLVTSPKDVVTHKGVKLFCAAVVVWVRRKN